MNLELAIGATIALMGAYRGDMRRSAVVILAVCIYIYITWGMYIN